MGKKVAIIGAGASGLTAIKCCLDEGLEAVCYERTSYIGGLWHYTEQVEAGQACVMKSTFINSSKEMMSFSDFPVPKEYPIYMHNRLLDRYFHLYADHFKLKERIRFHTEVLSIKPSDDFPTTGRWDVSTRNHQTGETSMAVYDAVMICTGHHAEVHVPTFPGLKAFKGRVLHSHDYKHSGDYGDQRVVIVGIGNSGGDTAVDLGKVAAQVYLSTRRGTWVFTRTGDNGMPVDMDFSARSNRWLMSKLPHRLINYVMRRILNKRFDHRRYALEPRHSPFAAHPTVNDELPNRIASGSIIIKPNVAEFTETGVQFDDGTFEDDIDAVILATGYIFGFPFLDRSVIEVKENVMNLYKHMFPPDLARHTLAVIGCVQPLGSTIPISELQSRLATRVFKGDVTLPAREDMWQDIQAKLRTNSAVWVPSMRHSMQVDCVGFMDELAGLMGCMPDFKTMALTDPRLAVHCYFGPCSPYQYRLTGPGSWRGARDAILTQWERTYYPLNTRPLPLGEDSGLSVWKLAIVAVIISVLLYAYIL